MRRCRALAVLAAALFAAACSSSPTREADPAVGAVFEQMPPCEAPPETRIRADDVDGLVLPEGAIVTATQVTGPGTDVTAYVAQTPLEVRADYEARQDVEILRIEDEVFETEVLLADGDLRSFVRARVACRSGSTITAFIAPASASAAMPTLPSVPGTE